MWMVSLPDVMSTVRVQAVKVTPVAVAMAQAGLSKSLPTSALERLPGARSARSDGAGLAPPMPKPLAPSSASVTAAGSDSRRPWLALGAVANAEALATVISSASVWVGVAADGDP